MKLPKFDYAVPTTIDEAVTMLARADGSARVIAGGQSLMPMLAFRLTQPSLLVDLRRLPGLDKITVSADGVHLGAKTRWLDIERCDALPLDPLELARLGVRAMETGRRRGWDRLVAELTAPA